MNLFKYMRDGGSESKVDGYWLIEAKSLFSIALLHFHDGSREAFHSHAFNSLSWVLKGSLIEVPLESGENRYYPSLWPILTLRSMFHMVKSLGDTWVITFRGPWSKTWQEYIPKDNKFITLTHGRKIVC